MLGQVCLAYMETSVHRKQNVTETPSTCKIVLFYLLVGVMFQVFILGFPGIQYITFHTFLHVLLWPLFVAYYFVIAALALAGIWIIGGIIYFFMVVCAPRDPRYRKYDDWS